MSKVEEQSRLRREQDILDRLDNVKRLIQMETTLTTCEGAENYCGFYRTDRNGQQIGSDDLLHDLRDTIQLQLLSIVALCYGDNPDIGEPMSVLEWNRNGDGHPEDKFREVWEECLEWNA